MAEKEHVRLDCTVHSGIRAEIDDLKENDTKQWDLLGLLQTTKASSSQMRWVVGIFLIISMAVVGFLWGTQSSSTNKIVNKIEVMETQAGVKRDETNLKLDTLKDKVNELKWAMDFKKEKSGGNKLEGK